MAGQAGHDDEGVHRPVHPFVILSEAKNLYFLCFTAAASTGRASL